MANVRITKQQAMTLLNWTEQELDNQVDRVKYDILSKGPVMWNDTVCCSDVDWFYIIVEETA